MYHSTHFDIQLPCAVHARRNVRSHVHMSTHLHKLQREWKIIHVSITVNCALVKYEIFLVSCFVVYETVFKTLALHYGGISSIEFANISILLYVVFNKLDTRILHHTSNSEWIRAIAPAEMTARAIWSSIIFFTAWPVFAFFVSFWAITWHSCSPGTSRGLLGFALWLAILLIMNITPCRNYAQAVGYGG